MPRTRKVKKMRRSRESWESAILEKVQSGLSIGKSFRICGLVEVTLLLAQAALSAFDVNSRVVLTLKQ